MGKLALSISTVEREQNWSLVILQSLVALYLLLHIGVSCGFDLPHQREQCTAKPQRSSLML